MYMFFGEKLKKIRNEKNVTQEEVARVLGLSRQTISAYEMGTRYPDYDRVFRLAEYFGVSFDDFLEER